VQNGTTYADSIDYSTPIIRVAALDDNGENFTGYMDDVRISLFARYTADFSPPAAAFPLL
jgi:hypothetical protein